MRIINNIKETNNSKGLRGLVRSAFNERKKRGYPQSVNEIELVECVWKEDARNGYSIEVKMKVKESFGLSIIFPERDERVGEFLIIASVAMKQECTHENRFDWNNIWFYFYDLYKMVPDKTAKIYMANGVYHSRS